MPFQGVGVLDRTTGQTVFDATENSIQAQNGSGDAEVEIFDRSFTAGDKIRIANSGSNNGTYVIAEVSEDGSKIFLADTTRLLADETDTDGVLFQDSRIVELSSFSSETHQLLTSKKLEAQALGVAVSIAGSQGSDNFISIGASGAGSDAKNQLDVQTSAFVEGGDGDSSTADVEAESGSISVKASQSTRLKAK